MLFICSVVLCAAAVMAQNAPTSIFQLNGDPANDHFACFYSGDCDYWNLINGAGSSGTLIQTGVGHSSVSTFVNGAASTDSFTGGGSKDFYPISKWAYSSTPTPNKDTLNAAYAAAYQIQDFDVIFGADRLSPNGDANIGIWFFQQSVGPNGSGGFTGAHQNGDVFLISAFTGGGGTSTISVYAWDNPNQPNAINGGCSTGVKNPTPGQCADSNLLLLASPTSVCGSSPYCAITNSKTVNATWASYSNFQIASPLFFEGGVDITAAFASVGITTLPCFSSFLVETRSSQSTSAVLKDFIAGGFPVCGMKVDKTCGTASPDPNGTTFDYPVTGTVTNTGIGTLYLASVTDVVTHSNNATETLTLAVSPSTLTAGQVGSWSTTIKDPGTTVSDTASASGNTASDGSGTTVNSTNQVTKVCSTSLATQLSVTKGCSTSLSASGSNPTLVAVQVAFSGSVCNSGPSSVTGIALEDFQSTSGTGVTSGITLGSTTLGPATGTCSTSNGVTTCSIPACTQYSGTYTPSGIDTIVSGGTGPGRYFFNDLVAVSGAKSSIGSLQTLSGQTETRCNGTFACAPASCPICQGSGECTTQ
jgi:hypothetical protein